MATLVIEDGTGKANSNTYISAANFEAFCSERNIALTTTYGDSSEVLIKANDYLQTLSYIGYKLTKAQALQWPRGGVVIDGFGYASNEIPQQLIDAQCWFAVSIDAGLDPMANTEQQVKRESLGSMSVEYMDGSLSKTWITSGQSVISKLLSNGGSLTSFNVVRA